MLMKGWENSSGFSFGKLKDGQMASNEEKREVEAECGQKMERRRLLIAWHVEVAKENSQLKHSQSPSFRLIKWTYPSEKEQNQTIWSILQKWIRFAMKDFVTTLPLLIPLRQSETYNNILAYMLESALFIASHTHTYTFAAVCTEHCLQVPWSENIQVKVANKLSIKYLIFEHTRRIMNLKSEKRKNRTSA